MTGLGKSYEGVDEAEIQMISSRQRSDDVPTDIEQPRIHNFNQSENENVFAHIKKWHILAGVQCVLFLWLFIVSTILLTSESNKNYYSTTNQVVSGDGPTAGVFALTSLANGKTSLDISADEIRMIKPLNYNASEVVKNGVRSWDSGGAMLIYVGDSVTWTWTTNENIISCDESGLISPTLPAEIKSGPLSNSGTFTKQFHTAGTYFYCSENSQTMSGKVVVEDQPSFSLLRGPYMGPVPAIPSGVQTRLTPDDLKRFDGCWQPCVTPDVPFTTSWNYNTAMKQCSGDWIFMTVLGPNPEYFMGAFARKDVISAAFVTESSTRTITVSPTLENGAYWFGINNQNYGYQTVGFTGHSGSLSAPWGSYGHQVNCEVDKQCATCLNWSNINANVGCLGYVQDPTYRKVMWTNTCPLIAPPV